MTSIPLQPEPLLVEQLGPVRRLTLNRPEHRNALDGDLRTALIREVEDAGCDPDTSVLLLRGAGNGFSAGADLGGDRADSRFPPGHVQADVQSLRKGAAFFETIWACPIPIVAQVHGYCLAQAADLVLHADILLVAIDAVFGHPPVRTLGVPPAHMWLYRAGPQLAKRLLLTGDTITGQEAVRVGIALSCFAPEELDTATLSLAERLSLVHRDMLVANKAVINAGVDLMGRPILQQIAQVQDAIAHSSPSAAAFWDSVATIGLRRTLKARDDRFGGRATVDL
jgi:enoyl-CoA hydratase